MAQTLTPNIKLTIDDSFTPISQSNLLKIDDLGSLYQVDSTANARIRSQQDILLQPHDPNIGGDGIGGSINLGSVDQPVTSVNLYATSFNISSILSSSTVSTSLLNLTNSGFTLGLQAPVLTGDLTLTLPANDGSPNQVLTTDGNGILSWTSVAGAGDFGAELTEEWLAADGLSKTVTHNFGTRYVMVQVIDLSDTGRTVEVDEILRPTENTVILNSSMAPSSSWTVLLKQITQIKDK